ncbi:MAG: hypothetical protein ABEK04_02300, partial [Candidatus Nanohalobium sp.]
PEQTDHMSYEDCLPFGKTDITSEEYREQIDYDKALEILEENGVEDAEKKLEAFIQEVPDMLEWLEENGREYPWRYTTDPWKVYVAEILLQRTRGDAVAEVYPKFIGKFSDPESLYESEEEDIRKEIKSLGFINHRTKTLNEAGKIFMENFDGKIPDSGEKMKKPWRVGDYVANAVQLFAFGEARPLIDSNIEGFIENKLDFKRSQRAHKDKIFTDLMRSLTPENAAIARSFYLTMIDFS